MPSVFEPAEEATDVPEPPTNGDGFHLYSQDELRTLAEEVNVVPEPSDSFVVTPYVDALTARALAYLEVGYALHFVPPYRR